MTTSDYAFGRTASFAQRAASNYEMLQKTVGSDQELGDAIVIFDLITNQEKIKIMVENPLEWVIMLMDGLRISHFANSERTDIISKLGFFLPQKEIRVVDE